MAVRVSIDQGALNALLRSPSGPVARELYRRGKRVEAAAKRLVGVDTGRLRASISTDLIARGGVPVARVGTRVRYGLVHHEGHGWIYPKRPGGRLVFRPKGSRTLVFATKVRPVPGTHYLTRALPAAR